MADKALSPEIMKLMDKIANNPTSRLFVPLAEEYLKSEMLEEAIFVLVDGIKNHPTYVAARVMLGKIYLQTKQIAEAKKEFEQVIAVNPENILAGKKLAAIYQTEGEIQKAFDACKKILMIDPSDKETKLLLSSLEKQRAASPPPAEMPALSPNSAGTEVISSSMGEGEQGDTPLQAAAEGQPPLETSPSFAAPSLETEALDSPSSPAEEMDPKDLPPAFLPEGKELEGAPGGEPNGLHGEAVPDEIKIFDGPLFEEAADIEEVKRGPLPTSEGPPEINSAEKPVLSGFSEPFPLDPPSSGLADSPLESEPEEELATTTLASLYIDQGHFKEAVEIYRKILARDPANKESLKGLEYALEKLNGPSAPRTGPSVSENNRGGQSQGKTQRLQSWLDSIRKDKEG